MEFTEWELQIIRDREFLISKAKVLSKIHELLTETRAAIDYTLKIHQLAFPPGIEFTTSKISSGDNYLGLPYQVLDYPATFSSENVFAYRTMFWWGNFFSATFHLQGDVLDYYRNKIIENINGLENDQIYISVGQTPWHYHYENDNYKLLTANDIKSIEKLGFLKLSKKMNLDNWQDLPTFSSDFFAKILAVLCS